MKLHFVDTMDEVLKIALERPLADAPVVEPEAIVPPPQPSVEPPAAHQ